MTERVYLREVVENDLPEIFEYQRDPVASEMAAFPSRERAAFMVHSAKILADDTVTTRIVVIETDVAGHVVCFAQAGEQRIGYWLGRRFWGRGIASRALAEFVSTISARPLVAYVAKHNAASMRVLEKCGFERVGEDCSEAPTGGGFVEEFVYSLSD